MMFSVCRRVSSIFWLKPRRELPSEIKVIDSAYLRARTDVNIFAKISLARALLWHWSVKKVSFVVPTCMSTNLIYSMSSCPQICISFCDKVIAICFKDSRTRPWWLQKHNNQLQNTFRVFLRYQKKDRSSNNKQELNLASFIPHSGIDQHLVSWHLYSGPQSGFK